MTKPKQFPKINPREIVLRQAALDLTKAIQKVEVNNGLEGVEIYYLVTGWMHQDAAFALKEEWKEKQKG